MVDSIETGLRSDEFVADPYPTYRMLRDDAPVYRSDAWDSWIVSRHDDVLAILKDARGFSSAGRFEVMLSRLPSEVREAVLERYPLTSGLFQSDPPEYTRHRRLIGQALASRLPTMPPLIEQIVDEAIAAGRRRGSIDVVADLAAPLPAEVIFRALGVPVEDRARFKGWSSVIISFLASGVPDRSKVDDFGTTVDEAQAWLGEQIARRRRQPGEDMLSELATDPATAVLMTGRELLVTLIQFLVAGHETTTNLIANGTLSVLRHPDAARALREDRSLDAPAIEEMLRFESPLQRLARVATADTVLGDHLIRAGDLVMVLIGSANRDPARFADPDVFDIRRRPNRHLAFGHGPHFCMGASLARIEASIAFDRLLPRLQPDAPLPAVSWRSNVTFRGMETLRIGLD